MDEAAEGLQFGLHSSPPVTVGLPSLELLLKGDPRLFILTGGVEHSGIEQGDIVALLVTLRCVDPVFPFVEVI